ncbi:hypothetical protein JMJ77_0002378 [Colletotrichum scovillei]|uniref:Uncharacterized protein n=1 Tax=Colletotrichum scovillei TaxID=1209932 RepID=A0A9P7R7S3_9PEZI|nr:hypothetical protein JMJ77_0002378 [Colletotrichum scovillei]KAG7070797.1 hypothetical protein JMJ76_0002042 [Colletotrichum scovillei]KAG7079007.1 hypothetical protein JMJ78_0002669 [Colletotrichum scovillei]
MLPWVCGSGSVAPSLPRGGVGHTAHTYGSSETAPCRYHQNSTDQLARPPETACILSLSCIFCHGTTARMAHPYGTPRHSSSPHSLAWLRTSPPVPPCCCASSPQLHAVRPAMADAACGAPSPSMYHFQVPTRLNPHEKMGSASTKARRAQPVTSSLGCCCYAPGMSTAAAYAAEWRCNFSTSTLTKSPFGIVQAVCTAHPVISNTCSVTVGYRK